MTVDYTLNLYHDQLQPQAASVGLDAQPARALYVVDGALRLQTDAAMATLAGNSAWHHTGWCRARAGSAAASVLRWELTNHDSKPAMLTGDGVASRLLLSATLALDPEAEYLLRCDRVDFPPGGEALTHTHRGGGIRCLLFGGIEIDTQGATHAYGPLEPWFEAGPDPVYAAASKAAASAFARVMILPRELLGKSSITYVKPEDLAKPKSQRYQIFIDAAVELPD